MQPAFNWSVIGDEFGYGIFFSYNDRIISTSTVGSRQKLHHDVYCLKAFMLLQQTTSIIKLNEENESLNGASFNSESNHLSITCLRTEYE